MYIIKYIVLKVLKQLFYRNLCKMHSTIYTIPEAKTRERKSELYFEELNFAIFYTNVFIIVLNI